MAKKKDGKWDGIYQQYDTDKNGNRKLREGYIISWRDAQGRRRRRTVKATITETIQTDDGRTLTLTPYKQAEKALVAEQQKVETEIRTGTPLPSKDSSLSVADDYLRDLKRRESSVVAKGNVSAAEYERRRGIVESHLKPFFKDVKLAAIRRADVIRYINARRGEVSDGSVIKEVNTLKFVFNYALDLDKITATPAIRLSKYMPREPAGRKRCISNEELGRVLNACELLEPEQPRDPATGERQPRQPLPPEGQWLQNVAGLAVALGTRRGELLAVKLPDINLETGAVVLRKTKNGKERTVYLNDMAWQVLNRMNIHQLKSKGKNKGLLFPDVDPAQVSVYFARACEKVDVEDFSFHDLRHTYASHLRMSGRDLHDIQELLGHSDPRMTARYAHLGQTHLSKAAQGLNGVLSLPAPAVEPGTSNEG